MLGAISEEVRMTRRLFLALALAALVIHAPQAQSSWRPTVMGTQGMVAAGHPLAAEVGMRVLKAGGNAVDAAIAAWAIQGQVEPGMTGLGADMFALIYLAKTKEVKFINGTGYAPKAATIDYYNAHGGMPDDGGLSIAVPGAVGGAALALEKYGTKTLADVLAPAIEVAEQGYPITENLARGLEGGKGKLGKFPSTTKIWFRDGKPLVMGDVVKNPDLAKTLRAIATQGPAGFYTGPVAKALVAGMRAHGGIISEEDLASYKAFEAEPIHVNYRGYEVYECPPNSQGHTMLQALNLLEGFNLRYMGHNSAAYLHVVTESIKLAFADRNQYVADPAFTPNIPMRELLSKEYAAKRRALIDPNRAIVGEAPYGDPRGRHDHDRRPSGGLRRAAARAGRRQPLRSRQGAEPDHLPHRRRQGPQHGLAHLEPAQRLRQRPGARGHRRDDERPDEVLLPGSEGRQLAAAAQARAPDHQPGAGAEGRPAGGGVRHARRRHPAADAAPVLPQLRRVRHAGAAGARAADGDQQQLPQLLSPARGRGHAADADACCRPTSRTDWRRWATSSTCATCAASAR